MSESFNPHAAYEKWRQSLPDYSVGLRGQSSQFNETILEHGFDKRRWYFAINLSELDWDGMREIRGELHDWFDYLVRFGKEASTNKSREITLDTPEQCLTYFSQHPQEYISLLLLKFPGIRGWYHSHNIIRVSLGGEEQQTFQHKLSRNFIVKDLYLNQSDFERVREELVKRGLDLNDPKYKDIMTNKLSRLMLRKVLSEITHLESSER